MPETILSGLRYLENAYDTQTRATGTEVSGLEPDGDSPCCGDGCSPGSPIYTSYTDIFVPRCVNVLPRDFAYWVKDIDDVAADPDWNGTFDLDSPSDNITLDPSDAWTSKMLGPFSCGADEYCHRGRSYQYIFTPRKMIGDGKWTYSYTRRVVEDIDDGGCTCTATDIESIQNILVGFTYDWPDVPDGQDPDNGDWEIMQNMLKGTLESFVISWVFGSGMNHFRSTSPLGENLPLVSGLASPLQYPDRTGVLISDLNNSGFTISTYGGKIRAYSSFETVVQDEVMKVQPVGDHLYEWSVSFANANALQRNVCLMVHQRPV
jgi:hypothetical protein